MLNPLSQLAIIQSIHPMEWAIIIVVVLLIFGPKSLPSLGRALGKGLREFRSASSKFTEAMSDDNSDEEPKRKDEAPRRAPEQLPATPAPSAVVETEAREIHPAPASPVIERGR